MRMSLREIGAVSRALTAEFNGRIAFEGIAASHGDSEMVELLMSVYVDDCNALTTMLPVNRATRDDFERDLRQRLTALAATNLSST